MVTVSNPVVIDFVRHHVPVVTPNYMSGWQSTCSLKLTDCRVIPLSILQVLDSSCIPSIVPSYCYLSGTVVRELLEGDPTDPSVHTSHWAPVVRSAFRSLRDIELPGWSCVEHGE